MHSRRVPAKGPANTRARDVFKQFPHDDVCHGGESGERPCLEPPLHTLVDEWDSNEAARLCDFHYRPLERLWELRSRRAAIAERRIPRPVEEHQDDE